jgi:hypothetical protein
MGLGWLGYALMWRGYSMVKGYDLSLSEIVSPTHYYKGAWPPPQAGNAVVFPTGKTQNATSSGTSGTTSPSASGTCPPGYTYNPTSKKCIPPESM